MPFKVTGLFCASCIAAISRNANFAQNGYVAASNSRDVILNSASGSFLSFAAHHEKRCAFLYPSSTNACRKIPLVPEDIVNFPTAKLHGMLISFTVKSGPAIAGRRAKLLKMLVRSRALQ